MTTPTPTPSPTPPTVPPLPTITPSPAPVDPASVILNPSVNEVLTFVASIVGAIIWPAVVIFLILWFRGPIKNILDGLAKRMEQLKWVKGPGGIEAGFEGEVEDVAQRARDLPAPAEPATASAAAAVAAAEAKQVAESARNTPLELAKIAPAMAIVAAFIPVEEAVRDYIETRGFDIGRRSPIPAIRRDAKLPEELRAVLSDMAAVRNAAAHNRDLDLSYQAAVEYIESADSVAHQIRYFTARAAFGFDDDPRPPVTDGGDEP